MKTAGDTKKPSPLTRI